MHVSVIGLGYIGMPTAVVLAHAGHSVKGMDISAEVIGRITRGDVPTEEANLKEMLQGVLKAETLSLSTTLYPADIYVIVVPTPLDMSSKIPKPDMAAVREASLAISHHLKSGDLVILESTSPVGATRTHVIDTIEAERPDLKGLVHYAYCPERVLPGDMMRELEENDRVVGGDTRESAEKASAFYKSFVTGGVHTCTIEEAELTKLAENTYRDINIAYANELAQVCEGAGINVWDVIQLANHHPRVNIHQPGPGVGGHCIAVDPWFIVDMDKKKTELIQTARYINNARPKEVADKIKAAMKETGKREVALLGMAYKPGTDDMRMSPSVEVLKHTRKIKGISLHVVEPYKEEVEGIATTPLDEALHKADIIVMLTHHECFLHIEESALMGKTLIDTRGVWHAKKD